MTEKPESTRIGLIDLGSNAIRWEIVELDPPGYRSLDRKRIPIRIGDQVFSSGEISEEKIEEVSAAFARFARRCKKRHVGQLRAVGTSATREAGNASDLCEAIAKASGIDLEVISGIEECQLLLESVATVIELGKGSSLLADLGGGSIELACVQQGKITSLCSHPLGALRFDLDPSLRGKELLAAVDQVLQSHGQALIQQLADKNFDRYVAIGGNLQAICSILAAQGDLSAQAEVAVIKVAAMSQLLDEMAGLSAGELAERFNLGPDRADSIVPAARAYLWIAELSGQTEIQAPSVSLRVGLIQRILAARASS